MKRVYILQVVEETDDEVKLVIHSVYATSEKARQIGEQLSDDLSSGILSYYVSSHLIFQ